MNYKKEIFTNTLYQLLAKFLSTFSTLFLSTLIIRLLGAYTWGEYSTVLAYVTFFYIFCEFGLNSIAAREFSKQDKIYKNDFINFLLTRVLNTFLVLLLAIFGLLILNFPIKITQAILISFLGIFAFSIGSSFNAVFQAKLLYKYLFYGTLVSSVFNVVGFIFLFNYIKVNFYFLFFILIFSDFLRTAVSTYFAFKLLEPSKVKIDIKIVKFYFFSALPIGIAIMFNTLMIQIDKIMLSKMRSPLEVGYYALAYKIFDVILVFPTFFMNSAFSILVKKNSEKGTYSSEYSKGYYFLLLISLFFTMLVFVLSPILIPVIWGREMFPSVFSLFLLVSGTVFFYLSSPVSWTFVVENKQKLLIYVYFFGFLFNFLLNIIAIYFYGFLGASVVTILTEIYVLITLEILRIKYLKVRLISPFKLKWKN